MRLSIRSMLLASLCTAAVAMTAAAQDGNTAHPGDVIQSAKPAAVSQQPTLPALQLSDDQKAKIKQVLSGENTEVTFSLETTKPAKGFNPAIGAKIPAGLKAHSLPPPLIYQMPELKRFTYLKLKGQVLIINPMSGKIVDMFPETSASPG